ncbi:MAG: glucokinase [bacterium]
MLAPGTGLGQAFLISSAGKSQAYPTECGHIDFAATTDLEIELLQYLRRKYGRASYERILCGPGLVNLYEFFKESKQAPEPPALKERLQNEDPATVISSAGQAGEFEICVEALNMFVSILGTLAGNLVFSFLATGGVYLGGGIAPKMLAKLAEGLLVERYLNRGRLSYLVEKTSLAVIKDDHAALLGAASIASSFQ